MSTDCSGQPCAYCGAPATHLCTGCGNCLCNSLACNAKGVAATLGFPVTKYQEQRDDTR